MKLFGKAALAGTVACATVPNVKLNNGVEMPQISLGTWQYDSSTAEAAVKLALQTGFNHIDTAHTYNNQDGVGRALKDVDRSKYFLTTKVPNGNYDQTKQYLDDDMQKLSLGYVDLMLVHFPPRNNNCKDMQGQWKAMEEFYKAGKAKAIGVSNYCISSLKCIAETATVTPAVNQVQFHVGMGADPAGLKSYCDSKGIVTQAYSPLGDGSKELITGELVTGIGKAHNMTGAQVSLRWLIETGVPLTTKTSKASHMEQDLSIFGFKLEDTEKSQLDHATSPAGKPSFKCTSAAVAAPKIPTIKLNTGVEMPMISLGTWQYNSDTAESAVKLALQSGFNHIDTANDYGNQDGVGKALKGVDRSSFFLTTKVPPANSATTKKNLQADLDQLGLDFVDLMLVHYPPTFNNCGAMQDQWKAMEEFYKAGKAKAIGVSNYCISSLECIAKTATVTPAVNQVKFHVGMGADPAGLKSYCDSKGIVTQAYSPLGDGSSELITGALVTGIGKAHNMTGAQVSLRWIIETGVPLTTKTSKASHMEQDLGIFGFKLEDTEKSQLDHATSPAGKPSFICSSEETVVV